MANDIIEQWAPVTGYETVYEVSSLGRVRRCKSGILVQTKNPSGYPRVFLSMNGEVKQKSVHRLVCSAFLGLKADQDVDHIDGDRANNAVFNLRVCTQSQNSCNRGKNKNNTSGFKGVSWRKSNKKWGAKIVANGVSNHLGFFTSKADAVAAYREAASALHGEYAKC